MARFIAPWTLWRYGILGINRRNSRYIATYNPRSLFPLVDNKLKTKQTVRPAEIPTPAPIGVIEEQSQVGQLAGLLEGHAGFAIKPAKGSGGKGIIVITGRDGDNYVKASGAVLTIDDLKRDVSNILAGLYSLGGKPDVALIEELIHGDPRFDRFTFEGVPDIRVIVCRGYPVMAMMRLATQASDGKANLHQGAVGVGLDMATGRALNAVQFGLTVTHHPDTGQDLSELQVPDWDQLLVMASRCYDATGLGYLGTDIVMDRDKGPQLLELNARPGLAIQVANGAGLLPRLRRIDGLSDAEVRYSPERRAKLSQKWFAGSVEQAIES